MKVVKASAVAMILLAGGCNADPTANVAADLGNTGAGVNAVAPATGSPQEDRASVVADDLRAFVVGRWTLNGDDCRDAAEFRADGSAIRSPGSQVDRWTLERIDGHNVLRITEADGGGDTIRIEREGSDLRVQTADGRRVILTRC